MLQRFRQLGPIQVHFPATLSVLNTEITAVAQFKLIALYVLYKDHHFGGLLLYGGFVTFPDKPVRAPEVREVNSANFPRSGR
jgi:hypothetical protein